MNTNDSSLCCSWSSHEDDSHTVLQLDNLSNCATDGHHPATGCHNCPCEFNEDEIFEWFRLKGIRHGSPEEALHQQVNLGRDRIECLSLGGGKPKGKGKSSILARRLGKVQVELDSS